MSQRDPGWQMFDAIQVLDTDDEISVDMEICETDSQQSEVIEVSDTEDQPSDDENHQMSPGCEASTESDAILKHLPFIKKKPNIKKVFIALHELRDTLPVMKKCEQSEDQCTFCKYHVDLMEEIVCSETSQIVCEADNVAFLVYCISCDQVWISFLTYPFKYVSFGFSGYQGCQPNQKHNKRNIRYMMINKFESQCLEGMQFWENYLGLSRFYLSAEPIPELDGWVLYEDYHYMLVSDTQLPPIKDRKAILPKTENIVYLIMCNNCDAKYVGKTKKRFINRYPRVLSRHHENTRVNKHFNGRVCTVRDYRWTVIDALSSDQRLFLEKWRNLFDKCDIDIKKKIWAIMSNECYSFHKKVLIEVVWHNEEAEVMQLLPYIDTSEEDDNRILMESVNRDLGLVLSSYNENWIKNTKDYFLQERENYWITELNTIENGLNVRNGSNSTQNFPNLYNDFFESLGNK